MSLNIWKAKINTKQQQQPEEYYYAIFEDYLKPKKIYNNQNYQKKNKEYGNDLLFYPAKQKSRTAAKTKTTPKTMMASNTVMAKNVKRNNLNLKLLQHPILKAKEKLALQRKWQKLYENVQKTTKRDRKLEKEGRAKTVNNTKKETQIFNVIFSNNSKWLQYRRLPNFLAFLRARNDDGLCKRKTGFEIYCEMASIHGFINFVGAKTWQRIFWCSVVCFAILMSIIILTMSHLMSTDTPTIIYTESTTYPAWTMPFPAITICNLNRISKMKAKKMALAAKENLNSTLTITEIVSYFRYALYSSDHINEMNSSGFYFLQNFLLKRNLTIVKFLDEISPDCEMELLRCKWRGRIVACEDLFHKAQTTQGVCCAFNYHGEWQKAGFLDFNNVVNSQPEQTTSCGYRTGLTVLLQPNVDDYMAAWSKSHGYQVLLHDAYDYADHTVARHIIQMRTETYLTVTPQHTHATDYLPDMVLHKRRCYFSNEYRLRTFRKYTQANCLAECRSKMFVEKCKCIPAFLPLYGNATICNLRQQSECVAANKEIFSKMLKDTKTNYKTKHYVDQFICDCYPPCDFNQYGGVLNSGLLNRTFSLGQRRFFKNITLNSHILLHVFYGDLTAERLRLDIYENWLSFVGTFGGITGLYMGYSFVSGFELIFFVFVRPACNWLTRQQIRYRIKRRQRKAAAAAAAAAAAKMAAETKAKAEAAKGAKAAEQERVVEEGKLIEVMKTKEGVRAANEVAVAVTAAISSFAGRKTVGEEVEMDLEKGSETEDADVEKESVEDALEELSAIETGLAIEEYEAEEEAEEENEIPDKVVVEAAARNAALVKIMQAGTSKKSQQEEENVETKLNVEISLQDAVRKLLKVAKKSE